MAISGTSDPKVLLPSIKHQVLQPQDLGGNESVARGIRNRLTPVLEWQLGMNLSKRRSASNDASTASASETYLHNRGLRSIFVDDGQSLCL